MVRCDSPLRQRETMAFGTTTPMTMPARGGHFSINQLFRALSDTSVPMIVALECELAPIRGPYKSKRLSRSRIRRGHRSGMTTLFLRNASQPIPILRSPLSFRRAFARLRWMGSRLLKASSFGRSRALDLEAYCGGLGVVGVLGGKIGYVTCGWSPVSDERKAVILEI